MTDQHPITPSSEFAAQLRREAPVYRDGGVGRELWLIDKAAQWGADQELGACVMLVDAWAQRLGYRHYGAELRTARRPKPPSLKEEALNQLRALNQEGVLDRNTYLIRRALEQLSDD